MTIYFGHPIPTTSRGKRPEASEELKAKGIELLRCAPSDMNIIGVPTASLATWGLYTEYFSTILYSMMKSEAVSLFPSDLELSMSHTDPLPIQLPALCVLPKTHNQDAIEFLGNNHFEMAEIRGSTYFLCSTITRPLVRKLISPECPVKFEENSFCPYRFVNLSALYSALDFISFFSYAVQAMDFMTTDSEDIDRGDFNRDGPGDDDGGVRMNLDEGEVDMDTLVKDLTHPIAKLFPQFSEKGSTAMLSVPAGMVDASCITRNPWASTSNFSAKQSGLVIRFVPELANEDKTCVLSFIQRYMFWNLGNGVNDALATLNQLKSSWGNLQSTDFGLALSHLARCMLLAMESQSSLTPIFDMGYYEGCILQGENFSLSVNNLLIRPLSNKKLDTEVKTLATHESILERIAAIMRREVKIEVDSKEFTSVRVLREKLLRHPLTEAAKEEITALAKHLRFPSRPWNVNTTSLMKMIEIIRGLPVLTDDTPIGPRGLFSKDMVVVALSCFGEGTCPSLYHANGTPIDLTGALPRPSGKPTPNRENLRGKQSVSNAAWTFAVRRVRFDEALGDLRNVLRSKQARSVSSSVARGLGCVVISGKQFGELFAALKDLASILSGTSEHTKSTESQRVGGQVDNDDIIPSGEGRRKRVKV